MGGVKWKSGEALRRCGALVTAFKPYCLREITKATIVTARLSVAASIKGATGNLSAKIPLSCEVARIPIPP